MKKIFWLFLALSVTLVACGGNEDDVSAGTEKNEKVSEANEANNDNEIIYELNNEKKLGVTAENIFKIESIQKELEKYSSIKTYETNDNITISYINRGGNLQLFIYQFQDDDYPSAVVTKTNAVPTVNEDAVEVLTDILVSLDEDVHPFVEVVPGIDDDDYVTVGIVFNDEHDINDLPIFMSDIASDDFFSDKSLVEYYNNSIREAEYKELYEKVSSYINDNDIEGHDSAYEIKEIIEPIQESMDKVEVHYDDFDDLSTIYYQGLTDISNSNYIVPFITTNDNIMNFLVGFEKDGWIFADNLVFNIDGERESFGTFNFDTETLGGSLIREEDIKTSYDDELIGKIIDATEVKMRFEGSKGELDYTLTDKDIEAIKTIHTFDGIKNNLSDLLFRFENN